MMTPEDHFSGQKGIQPSNCLCLQPDPNPERDTHLKLYSRVKGQPSRTETTGSVLFSEKDPVSSQIFVLHRVSIRYNFSFTHGEMDNNCRNITQLQYLL